MKSQGHAPKKRGCVKLKRPLRQRMALWLLDQMEGKNKKPDVHIVKNDENRSAGKAVQPAKRPTDRRVENQKQMPKKKASEAVKPQNGQRAKTRVTAKRVTLKKAGLKARFQSILRTLLSIDLKRYPGVKKRLYILAGAAVVFFIMLILSRTVLFKIDNINIVNPGDVSYTGEQMKAETGILPGVQNLFSCDTEKIERNIEQRLPYIGDAVAKKDFPSSIEITVTPTSASAAIVYEGGYLLIDENGKMLELTQIAPETVPVVRTSVELKAEIGHYLGDETKLKNKIDEDDVEGVNEQNRITLEIEMMKLIGNIRSSAEKSGLYDGITLIDIRDTRAITLMYEKRLTLRLGNESQLDDKLSTGAKIIARESDSERVRTGAINLENPGTGYSIDTYEDIPTTENVQENPDD